MYREDTTKPSHCFSRAYSAREYFPHSPEAQYPERAYVVAEQSRKPQ